METLNYQSVEDALEAYKENSDTYECILVEIKQVEIEVHQCWNNRTHRSRKE